MTDWDMHKYTLVFAPLGNTYSYVKDISDNWFNRAMQNSPQKGYTFQRDTNICYHSKH